MSQKKYFNLLILIISILGFGFITSCGDPEDAGVFTTSPEKSPDSGSTTYALDFDGSSEHLGSSYGYLGVSTHFTISTWIKMSTLPVSNSTVFHWGGGGNIEAIALTINSSGQFQVVFTNGSGFTVKDYVSTTTLGADTANHVVTTWNDSVLSLYINGVYESSLTKTTDDSFPSRTNNGFSEASIGSGVYTDYFDGKINSVAVWNTDLNAAGISTLYNVGDPDFDLKTDSGSYAGSSSLVHWWKLGNEGTDIAPDLGSSSLDVITMASDISTDDIVSF